MTNREWKDRGGHEIRLGDTVTSYLTPSSPGGLPSGCEPWTVTGFGRTRVQVTTPNAPGRVYAADPAYLDVVRP